MRWFPDCLPHRQLWVNNFAGVATQWLEVDLNLRPSGYMAQNILLHHCIPFPQDLSPTNSVFKLKACMGIIGNMRSKGKLECSPDGELHFSTLKIRCDKDTCIKHRLKIDFMHVDKKCYRCTSTDRTQI